MEPVQHCVQGEGDVGGAHEGGGGGGGRAEDPAGQPGERVLREVVLHCPPGELQRVDGARGQGVGQGEGQVVAGHGHGGGLDLDGGVGAGAVGAQRQCAAAGAAQGPGLDDAVEEDHELRGGGGDVAGCQRGEELHHLDGALRVDHLRVRRPSGCAGAGPAVRQPAVPVRHDPHPGHGALREASELPDDGVPLALLVSQSAGDLFVGHGDLERLRPVIIQDRHGVHERSGRGFVHDLQSFRSEGVVGVRQDRGEVVGGVVLKQDPRQRVGVEPVDVHLHLVREGSRGVDVTVHVAVRRRERVAVASGILRREGDQRPTVVGHVRRPRDAAHHEGLVRKGHGAPKGDSAERLAVPGAGEGVAVPRVGTAGAHLVRHARAGAGGHVAVLEAGPHPGLLGEAIPAHQRVDPTLVLPDEVCQPRHGGVWG
mmetsp:Transcript_91424/g.158471  ORF Transcript_91424/g.158471 Transcript_91424/m.158471 type:complete len:426 (-) Transcript_91424:3066-4343(-)